MKALSPQIIILLRALLLTLGLLFITSCGSARAHVRAPDGARHQMRGLASWYGQQFHGRPTASGEAFDMNAFTAAHKTLPFGTRIRVTHQETRKSVVVRVTDRGPFVKGRVVDLSYGAARELGMIQAGVVPVQLEVVRW